jgi:hypothetical protein
MKIWIVPSSLARIFSFFLNKEHVFVLHQGRVDTILSKGGCVLGQEILRLQHGRRGRRQLCCCCCCCKKERRRREVENTAKKHSHTPVSKKTMARTWSWAHNRASNIGQDIIIIITAHFTTARHIVGRVRQCRGNGIVASSTRSQGCG